MLERLSDRLVSAQGRLSRTVAAVLARPGWSLHIRGVGLVRIRTNSTDELVFKQVFKEHQYDISRSAQAQRMAMEYENMLACGHLPVIVDAGANVGAASIWFAIRYPRARVVAVEPEPENAAMCRINTERFRSVKVVEGAVGCRPGLVSLKIPPGAAWAVQTSRSEAEGGVRVHTIPDLVSAEGNDARLFIAKIDIEGFEGDLFETNLGWIDETRAIILEPHDWMFPEGRTSFNFQRAMAAREFELLISGENLVYVRLSDDEPQRPPARKNPPAERRQ